MSKTGPGKYLTKVKCPNGVDEEWTMTFTSNKLICVRFYCAYSSASKVNVFFCVFLYYSLAMGLY